MIKSPHEPTEPLHTDTQTAPPKSDWAKPALTMKRTLLVVAGMAVATGIAACGSPTTSSPEPPTQTVTEVARSEMREKVEALVPAFVKKFPDLTEGRKEHYIANNIENACVVLDRDGAISNLSIELRFSGGGNVPTATDIAKIRTWLAKNC